MSLNIIVIGGGITGISSAIFLKREGHYVTLIDPLKAGDEGQASFGNAGVIAVASVLPLASRHPARDMAKMLLSRDAPLFLRAGHAHKMIRFGREFLTAGHTKYEATIDALTQLTKSAIEDHLALNVDAAKALIKHGPFSYVYKSKREFEAAQHHFGDKISAGFAVRYLENTLLDEIDEELAPEFRFAAICDHHAWLLDPAAYLFALYDAFIAMGGRHIQSEVLNLDHDSVVLKEQNIRADKIIISAGAYSTKLLKTLGYYIPLEAERGYHIFFEDANHAPKHPVMHGTASFLITPMKHGLRAAGIAEYAGLNAPPRAAPMRFLERHLREIYPDIKGSKVTRWMGRRPTLPDSLPVIGALPNHPSVLCAFGGQHIGLTIGPRIGMIIRDIVMGQNNNADIKPFAIERFL